MSTNLHRLAARRRSGGGVRGTRREASARRARPRRRRPPDRRDHPQGRAALDHLPPGRRRRRPAADRRRGRHQRRPGGAGQGIWPRFGADVLVIDTAHGHQTRTLGAIEAVRAGAARRQDRRRQRGDRRGHAPADRSRCRHRQGRRRARCDVHDPDDDRRRAAAVLGGGRVRRRGAPARPAHLGRRRRALPTRRRAGPGWRRGERDVRVVARRAPTSRPPTRCAIPRVACTRRASGWRRTVR